MDPATADRVGRYLCVAAIAPARILHQAETYMNLPGILLERFWWWAVCDWL